MSKSFLKDNKKGWVADGRGGGWFQTKVNIRDFVGETRTEDVELEGIQ